MSENKKAIEIIDNATITLIKTNNHVFAYQTALSVLYELKALLTEESDKGELVEEIESLRQGFRTASDFTPESLSDTVFKMSMEAYHLNADRLVGELGGEAIRDENKATFTEKGDRC